MKKIIALILALVMCVSLAACGSSEKAPAATNAPASNTPAESKTPDVPAEEPGLAGTVNAPYIITFGNTAPASTDPENGYTVAAAALNEKLMELSGGTMGFELVQGGVYGSTAQHLAQVKAGTLDGMITGFDVATNLEGTQDFAACAMPFVFDSDEHMEKFLESGLWDEMVETMRANNGILITGMFMHQPPRIINSIKQISSPSDVSGLKIRVPESDVQIRVWTAAGASPVQVPGSELYSCLDTGIADAQENDIVSSSSLKLYEVAPYFTEINYIRQAQLCYTSEITWNKMNAQEKEWWQEAVAAACAAGTAAYDNKYEAAKDEIVAAGGTIVEFDYNEWKEFFTTIVKEQFDGTAYTAGLYDQIQAMA